MVRVSSLLVAMLLLCASIWARPIDKEKPQKVVVAYVTSWTQALPDTRFVTHINYAFGHVTETFDGVRIDNPQRLRTVSALKAANKELKVLLSIGGWGSGRFSEMAADDNYRKKFAEDCARVVKEYDLDGIDIDWEYPTSKAGGISASDDDTKNFTLLMEDIRTAIGNKKLLTLATVMSGKYIDFAAIKDVVDFVNIMAYDSGNPLNTTLHYSGQK
ncbi:glycoside hydrolase family 18 protein [Niabella hibiscisoli]|uniref:glycoside hydrolase family 18 protein n=1 Tax=Niabella hibiscisoli TaxID=1825928 RepID=UPI0021D44858|nr:glycosyl hydrolase family 18 protein [Niabella hibiscisoli]